MQAAIPRLMITQALWEHCPSSSHGWTYDVPGKTYVNQKLKNLRIAPIQATQPLILT
jgi:hypothetical protein